MRKLLIAFITSFCQSILFQLIYIVSMRLIPWPHILWVVTMSSFLIPMLSAFGCCFLVHRSNFRFDLRNMVSKVSVYRLAVRLMSVFCFLLMGYVIHLNNISICTIFGGTELVNFFLELLTNFNYYVLTAIFSSVYALAEYLFVSTNNNYSTDR